MRVPGLAVALALAVCAPVTAAEPVDPAEVGAFADRYFARQLSEHRAPGAVFVVVQGGRTILARGYGVANLETGTAADPELTLFRVGSVTKLFTATAAMQLVESGRLDLDDDVNEHLTSFQVEGGFAEPVRVWHLLTHTPGFDERSIGMLAPVDGEPDPLGPHLARHLPPRVLPPGSVYSYSNYGMALLGYLVERISGLPYVEYVQQNLLAPLGMLRSGFEIPNDPSLELAQGYGWTGERWRAVPGHPQHVFPAGALLSTGTDMARFMLAHLADGSLDGARILAPETARLMRQQRFTHDARLAGIALGFHERFENDLRTVEHSGDIDGFASMLVLIPAQDLGLFLTYNSADLDLRDELLGTFLDEFFPVEPEAFPAVPAGAAERAALISGSYRVNRYSRTTFEKLIAMQARVSADGAGQATLHFPFDLFDPIVYREVEPFRFRRVGREGDLLFYLDDGGSVAGAYVSLLGIPFATERVSALATYRAQAWIGGGVLLTLLSACILWPLAALRARWRGEPSGAPPSARRASLWAGIGAGTALLFVVAFALAMARGDLAAGVTGEVTAALLLGMLAALLLVPLPIWAVQAWRWSWWSAAGRIHYSFVAAAGLVFIVELWYWNLLGLNY